MQNVCVSADTTIEDDAINWKFVAAQDDRPAYYLYVADVQKSQADDREYRVVRLENGLEAVLVHDPKTDKAAASLEVAVGYFNDPDDIPGLAHFCEHLMFMGSKQFPKENEYDEFLSKNDGYCNAFTGGSDTTFFFSVASGTLKGALERFSDFFHSPLFSKSCTMREVNAVDSENSMNLQDDEWRINQVMGHLARPGHPLRKFGTGNKKTLTQAGRSAKSRGKKTATGTNASNETLKRVRRASHALSDTKDSIDAEEADENDSGLETRHRLIEWWKREYCAGRMSLAIIGEESLDELTHFVTTLFSPIKNRGQDPAPRIPEQPYGAEQLSSIVYVKTITDIDSVSIIFPIPYQAPFWHVKPAEFLAHLIGHEGPGSLHAYLKNKGWITSLETDVEEEGRGVSSFKLSADLTKEGLKNHREVVQTCFKFINLLRSSVLPEWFQDEIQTMGNLEFRFDEKVCADGYAQYICSLMKSPIPRALVLNGGRLTWRWDEQLVRQVLAELVIENSFVVVTSKDLSVIGKDGPWLKEPWYGTQYLLEKLDDEFMVAARGPNDISELSLPTQNEFIPTNVEVEKLEVPQPKKRPSLIKRSPLAEVWFKKDDQFWIPRARLVIDARTPVAGSSPRTVIMTRLFASLVNDALTEYSYDAELAGLSYDFQAGMRGLSIELGGYNDKLLVLAEHVLKTIKNLNIKEDRLALMKEKAQQDLENMLLGDPVMLAQYYVSYLMVEREFTVEEELAEISQITVEDLREHVVQLLSRLKYKILVTGNLRKEDALHIASMVSEVLDAGSVRAKNTLQDRARILPKSCNYVWERRLSNPDEVNSSVSYLCQVGSISDPHLRVVCRLLGQILQEPTFNILRTKEQLGYFVMSSTWEYIESIGFYVLIQSDRDPTYVEARIEAFLVHMRGMIEGMKEEEFEENKAVLIHSWTERLKNLSEEAVRFWTHIDTGYLDFQRCERDAELIRSVKKEDILSIFNEYLDPFSPSRSKLSVHMRSQSPPSPKLSERAAEKFYATLQKVGVSVDEEEFDSLCEEMHVSDMKEYWEEVLDEQLGNERKVGKVLAEFDRLVGKYPQDGYRRVELHPKVVFIKDGAEFRDSLKLSAYAKPVEDFEVE